MPYEDLGLWTQAHREDGTLLEGWLWARTRQGLFLAMDAQGHDIRFIPAEHLIASGHDQDDRAGFGADAEEAAERISKLGRSLEAPLRAALSPIDHSFISGVAARAVALGERLQAEKYGLLLDSHKVSVDELQEYAKAEVPQVLEIYRQLHDELIRCGVIDVVEEHQSGIREIPRKLTMPLACLAVATRYDFFLEGMTLVPIHSWSRQEIEACLATLEGGGVEQRQSFPRIQEDPVDRIPGAPKPPLRIAWTAPWITTSIRLLKGTAISAAAVGMGVSAFLSKDTLTLGVAEIDTAVALASAIDTGLAHVGGSLERMAGLDE
jgi:hypothetical protein